MLSFFWASATVVLLLVELLTGTFFCLILACFTALTALIAPLLPHFAWQACLAALSSTLGCLALALFRKRRNNVSGSPDLGRVVYVEAWKDGPTRVRYRGTLWDAVLKKGCRETPGRFRIVGFDSTALILEPEA